jgi:uncharacterized membrane protein SpoIIM required for sporulation
VYEEQIFNLPKFRAAVKDVVLVVVFSFLFGLVVCWLFPVLTSVTLHRVSSSPTYLVTSAAKSTGPWTFFLSLFLGNTLFCGLLVLLGILAPVLKWRYSIFRAIIVGLIGLQSFAIGGMSIAVLQKYTAGVLLATLLPHGVFEIPAVVFSGALALVYLGNIDTQEHGKQPDTVAVAFFFIRYVLPLLFIAAIVEVLITPVIISYAFSLISATL